MNIATRHKVYFNFETEDDMEEARNLLLNYYRTINVSAWPESAKRWKIAPFGRPSQVCEGLLGNCKTQLTLEEMSEGNADIPRWVNTNIHFTAIISDGVSISRISGINHDMLSCVHCVHSAEVKYSNTIDYNTDHNPTTINFGKRKTGAEGEKHDIAVFGDSLLEQPVIGEIYVCVDHVLKKKIWIR